MQPAIQMPAGASHSNGGRHKLDNRSPTSSPQDALQMAAVQAGVKANVKRAADHWRFTVGPTLFVPRRGLHESDDVTIGRLRLILKKVAHVNDRYVVQLELLKDFTEGCFTHQCRPGFYQWPCWRRSTSAPCSQPSRPSSSMAWKTCPSMQGLRANYTGSEVEPADKSRTKITQTHCYNTAMNLGFEDESLTTMPCKRAHCSPSAGQWKRHGGTTFHSPKGPLGRGHPAQFDETRRILHQGFSKTFWKQAGRTQGSPGGASSSNPATGRPGRFQAAYAGVGDTRGRV